MDQDFKRMEQEVWQVRIQLIASSTLLQELESDHIDGASVFGLGVALDDQASKLESVEEGLRSTTQRAGK